MGLNATKERRLNQNGIPIPMPVQKISPAAPIANSKYQNNPVRPIYVQQKTFGDTNDPHSAQYG